VWPSSMPSPESRIAMAGLRPASVLPFGGIVAFFSAEALRDV